ncbi:hypothetical protein NON20_13525 [Synechocystis sp. B12]|nr:hypothetical protein NON20_13525 [Synechocystis sp. B12]
MSIRSERIGITEQNNQLQIQQERARLDVAGRMPALGFDNILADWLYIQFIQYFGDDEMIKVSGYSLVPDYFEQIISRDPLFTDAISRADVAISLFTGEPGKSVELLSQALAQQPNHFLTNLPPYYLWRAKGNNELLFLGDIEAAKKSYAKSIVVAEAYDDDEARRIANISRGTIKFLESNPDSKFARISAWVTVLANRPDEKTVARVTQEIEELGGSVEMLPNGSIRVNVPEGAN